MFDLSAVVSIASTGKWMEWWKLEGLAFIQYTKVAGNLDYVGELLDCKRVDLGTNDELYHTAKNMKESTKKGGRVGKGFGVGLFPSFKQMCRCSRPYFSIEQFTCRLHCLPLEYHESGVESDRSHWAFYDSEKEGKWKRERVPRGEI